jgi:hypothetical protein
MFKPEMGKCSKCGIVREIWPEYKNSCEGCFDLERPPRSKYMINDVPLVRIIEDLLMERPIIKKIVEQAMVDYGVHRILRLESDGCVYVVTEKDLAQTSVLSKAMKATLGATQPASSERIGVNAADPELIPKLNKMIDKHLESCNFCQSVIESENK